MCYYGTWKNFKLDKKPKTLEDRLTLYVGFLIQNNRKSTTIRSYISAIKAILKEDGIELNVDQYLLTSLTKACRFRNYAVKARLPIQKGLLQLILEETDRYFNTISQCYLALMYKALFSTAYYGMFRVGELTKGSHPVLANDVKSGENKRKMLFILRTSKTH